MARAKRLIYQGNEGVRKGDYFNHVPKRDLEETDIAFLSDEQYAEITSHHPTLGPLYRDPDATTSGLENHTVEHLRDIANARGIEVPKSAKKDELIAAIEGTSPTPAKRSSPKRKTTKKAATEPAQEPAPPSDEGSTESHEETGEATEAP